ncbi:HTH-type transcriptional activator tipA [Corynebacterium pseudotuberculosis 1/06-A]|nr:HTH-type transcriptional activator tipA [Corynebacterium pseudotuberculosis 1/06-A]
MPMLFPMTGARTTLTIGMRLSRGGVNRRNGRRRKAKCVQCPDWQNAQASDAAFVSELHSAWQAGVRPGSAAADRIVALHREQIDQWYESSLSKQLILAQMYVSDDRFAAHYQGLAPYLLELIRDAAQRGGVDVDNPSWV